MATIRMEPSVSGNTLRRLRQRPKLSDLQKEKDIDGFLVHGASLKDTEFIEFLNSRQ